jgi:ABC-type oligopeptide transport system ATPase subunit
MWSDNEADIDLLQFRYLAAAATRLARTRYLLPTTIGVFGDWGSGKSTLIRMIRSQLEKDEGTVCVSFNGWLFEGSEDAKTALMGTILEVIQDQIEAGKTITDKGKELLGKLLARVNWMRVARYAVPTLLGMPQLTLASLGQDFMGSLQKLFGKTNDIDPKKIEELFKDAPGGAENVRRNIREFRADFASLLEEAEIETLVVFIDDLDRCLPDTIIETLEAIKLFLFVEGTAFIIGADPRLVEYAVRRRFPEVPGTETFEVGRDYLEKLIQNPMKVPPLSGAEIQSYMNLLFAERTLEPADYERVCATLEEFRPSNISDIAFGIEQARDLVGNTDAFQRFQSDLDLVAQIAPVLTPGLSGSPRRTKRFLNMLLLRMSIADDRGLSLQRTILAKLMLMEYLKPEFFKQLARLQAEQEGKPGELASAETYLSTLESKGGVAEAAAQPAESNIVASTNTTKALPRTPTSVPARGETRIPDVSERLAPKVTRANAPGSTKAESSSLEPAKPAITIQDLPAEAQGWLADAWMRTWLASEPQLHQTDLRPYFYIAHDTLGVTKGSQVHLSTAAKEVLNKLLDPGPVTQNVGLGLSEGLSDADATALFEALAQRIRQAEALDEKSPQSVLFRLVERRPDLLSQVVALYESLPESKIIAVTPTLLYNAANGKASMASALQLIERWSRSSINRLAGAAQAVLSRATKLEGMR